MIADLAHRMIGHLASDLGGLSYSRSVLLLLKHLKRKDLKRKNSCREKPLLNKPINGKDKRLNLLGFSARVTIP